MNLDSLRRGVRIRVGSPVSDDFFTDDILTDVVNLAINQIEEQQMWPWTEAVDRPTLHAGNGDVVTPADWRATRTVLLDAPWTGELEVVSVSDLLSWPDTYTGVGQVYAEMGGGISVRPIPNGTYGIIHVYYRQTPALVFDTDEPLMPDRFAGAVVAAATLILSEREGNKAMTQVYAQDVTNWTNAMRRAVRLTTGPIRPRVRPGGWL